MLEIPKTDTLNEVSIDNEVIGTLGRDSKFGKVCIFGEKAKGIPRSCLRITLEGITVGNLDNRHFILLTRKGDENVSFPVIGNFKPDAKIRLTGALILDNDYEVAIMPSSVKEVA